jgi:hypothetical protein
MPFAQNSVNLGPAVVNTPLVNEALTLANAVVTTTGTQAAVETGDDYLFGYALLAITDVTGSPTGIDVQIFGSDTDSAITTTGNLVVDFGSQTAAGVFFVPVQNLVPSVIPGSGPQPEPAIYQWQQVKVTLTGGSSPTANIVVVLFI